MELKMTVTRKGIFLTVLFLVMLGGLIFLGVKAYAPDCAVSYNTGWGDGLTQLIREIQTAGVVTIGMPNNLTFEVTHPSLCDSILENLETAVLD